MNFRFGSTYHDIRQERECSVCGTVAETVPVENQELCDGCIRPMTLERIADRMAWEEVTAVVVYHQFDLKTWYGDALSLVNKLIDEDRPARMAACDAAYAANAQSAMDAVQESYDAAWRKNDYFQ